MTDKPILFSAPMVKALLDGTKTQTRRILKHYGLIATAQPIGSMTWEVVPVKKKPPPYAVGDRLWVKEACWLYGIWENGGKTKTGKTKHHFHLLNISAVRFSKPDNIAYWERPATRENPIGTPSEPGFSWRTGMFMPRRYSRLTLTVTDVRVQRLMNISEKDAVAEGVADRGAYIELWKTLHGPTSWVENPWIVAVSFTVDKRNIDQIT